MECAAQLKEERKEVCRPVLGHSTDKYLPYLLTLFFFLLMNNLLGLVPLKGP